MKKISLKDLTNYSDISSNPDSNAKPKKRISIKDLKSKNSQDESPMDSEKENNEKCLFNQYKGTMTAREMMSQKPARINYAIPGLLPDGLAVLAGVPKSRKSFMCLNISIALASNTKPLNYFNENFCDVLYISFEDTPGRLTERLQSIIQKNNLSDEFLDHIHFPEFNVNFEYDDFAYNVDTLISDNPDIQLIIVDPLARSLMSTDDVYSRDQYTNYYGLFKDFKEITDEHNICTLFVHHTKKSKSANPVKDVYGNTAISAAMDTIMVLDANVTVNGITKGQLYVAGRDVTGHYQLQFPDETLMWEVTGNAEPEVTPERQDILALFRDKEHTLSTSEIADELGKSDSNISKQLRKLVSEGYLEKASYGKYKLPDI